MILNLKKKKKRKRKRVKKGIVSTLQKVISFELSQGEMTDTIQSVMTRVIRVNNNCQRRRKFISFARIITLHHGDRKKFKNVEKPFSGVATYIAS